MSSGAVIMVLCAIEEEAEVCQDSSAKLESEVIAICWNSKPYCISASPSPSPNGRGGRQDKAEAGHVGLSRPC